MWSIDGRDVVLTTVDGSSDTPGQLAIVAVRPDRYGRILFCLRSDYVRGDEDTEGDRETGYYSAWAEPTEDEKATPRYQELALRARQSERRSDEEYSQRLRETHRRENEERRSMSLCRSCRQLIADGIAGETK